MKWLLAALLLVVSIASSQTIRCSTVEFYGLGMTIFNPSERHTALNKWLDYNGSRCSTEDLVIIWNNLPAWAGTADSAQVRAKIIGFYQQALERETKK
jgi:hypothetical protein